MDWARILTYVRGMVDQELLARNEYLATENRILKDQLKGRLPVSDAERATLGEIPGESPRFHIDPGGHACKTLVEHEHDEQALLDP
jgi:hypothetical protein